MRRFLRRVRGLPIEDLPPVAVQLEARVELPQLGADLGPIESSGQDGGHLLVELKEKLMHGMAVYFRLGLAASVPERDVSHHTLFEPAELAHVVARHNELQRAGRVTYRRTPFVLVYCFLHNFARQLHRLQEQDLRIPHGLLGQRLGAL